MKIIDNLKTYTHSSPLQDTLISWVLLTIYIFFNLFIYLGTSLNEDLHTKLFYLGILLLSIISRKVRKTVLEILALSIITAYYILKLLKWIVILLYSLFDLIFKITDKLVITYNKLDKSKKTLINTIVLSLISLVLGKIISDSLGNILTNDNSTFVNPHEVSGYTKTDGTQVSGYWRDGDGNPLTSLTKEQGGGYLKQK